MNCIFCKITNGEIPTNFHYEGERVIAFADLNPQAPTHLLLVPKSHYENAAELAKGDPNALVEIFSATEQLAREFNLEGYRTVFNTGAAAGQSVFHAHLHLLGGRAFSWPPG
jgi:histidine triad (HIT) family protein